MKIVKYKKLSNNRYKIELDSKESIILYEDVILNNNLLYKKEIDNNLLKKINSENIYYEAYNKALKFVTSKMRSNYELDNYLSKIEIKEKEKKEIIKKLKDINLINDYLYVEAYVSDKINLTSDGPIKIKKDLLDKKIEEHIIDEEISKIDNDIIDERIKKIISKKSVNIKESNYMFKKRIQDYLIKLGYSSESIKDYINEIESDDLEIIKKDFDKLYIKLSKKYDSNKLKYEIKSRLYKKGYSINDIEKIINENITY